MIKLKSIYIIFLFFLIIDNIYSQALLKAFMIPDEIFESYQSRHYICEKEIFYAKHNKSTTVSVYQLENMDKIREYNLPERVISLDTSRNGRYLAIGAMGYWVQAWDTLTDTMLLEKQIIPSGAYDNYVKYIDISDDGNYIVTCGYEGDRIYSISKGDSLQIKNSLPGMPTYNRTIYPVPILPKEHGIMAINSSSYLINLIEETVIKKIDYQIFCVHDNLAFVNSSNYGYQLVDTTNPENWIVLKNYHGQFEPNQGIYFISQCKQYICFNSLTNRSAKVLNIENGNLLHDFALDKTKDGSRFIIVDISKNGDTLLLMKRSDIKEEVQLWDITNLKAMAEGSSTY